MCLNEIVNAPDEYICKTPHLVVQYIDWIQCRYLFVRAGSSPQSEIRAGSGTIKDSGSHKRYLLRITSYTYIIFRLTQEIRSVADIELDKNYMARGPNGRPIGIPRNAFPASREFRLKSTDRGWVFSSTQRDALLREAEAVDDTEDEEDLLFLLSDDEGPAPAPIAKGKGFWGWKGKGKGRRVEDVVAL
jgi:ubiquitin-conjugating enzyme E2 Q